MEKHLLLEGVVGSTAYGLNRAGSDVDRLGIFAYNTIDMLGLDKPTESIVEHEPDRTLHEIGKYMSLALKCNPTILELLWLDSYDRTSVIGNALVENRSIFLSTDRVRGSYGAYAMAQVGRLQRRHEEGKDGFSSDTKKRTAKHARHCFRLLHQGRELLETGQITIRVPDPSIYFAFDNYTVEQIVDQFNAEFADFNAAKSLLPDKPMFQNANAALRSFRRYLWT